jgi:hypothetical protein
MIFARRAGLSLVSLERTGHQLLYVDATELTPDAITLDMLARFALVARRCGYRLVLREVPRELAELIELAGLSDALPLDGFRPGSIPPRC